MRWTTRGGGGEGGGAQRRRPTGRQAGLGALAMLRPKLSRDLAA